MEFHFSSHERHALQWSSRLALFKRVKWQAFEATTTKSESFGELHSAVSCLGVVQVQISFDGPPLGSA